MNNIYISNSCIGSIIYGINKVEYNCPFIGTLIPNHFNTNKYIINNNGQAS